MIPNIPQTMEIIEVNNPQTRKEFLRVPKILYRNDPNWVCPLDSEIEGIFNPDKNISFRNGEAIRWILKDEKGKLIGRIAAFVHNVKSQEYEQPTGGIGFFECIDDQQAAHLLFDTGKKWLMERGMKAMDGPINFGENHNHWGLLVEGFTHPGYGMPYHFPYYRDLFESYGFKTYFKQFSYHKDLTTVITFPERFMKIADWVSKRPGFSFRHFRFTEADRFVADMAHIYNETWSSIKDDYTPMDKEEVKKGLMEAKAIVDEDLIWFAYHEDEPIAFFILFPDVNLILKHFNGKLTPWNMIRFLYMKATHKMTRLRAFVAGVSPKYQNSGIESAIFKHLFEVFRKKTYYREVELSWVGEYNPRMMAIYEAIGAVHAKTHITYRCYFDPSVPFKTYVEEVGFMRKENKKE